MKSKNNLFSLYLFETKRLVKYNVISIGAIVSVVWAMIIAFTKPEEAIEIYPMLLFVDVAMMSILMIGASMFFEKNEQTLKGLFVAPVKTKDVIMSKILGAMNMSVISFVVLTATLIISISVKGNLADYDIELYRFAISFVFIFLIGIANGVIGYTLTFFTKDFNQLLMYYMVYTLLFSLPVILLPVLYSDVNYAWILLVLPPQAMENLFVIYKPGEIDYLLIAASAYIYIFFSQYLGVYVHSLTRFSLNHTYDG